VAAPAWIWIFTTAATRLFAMSLSLLQWGLRGMERTGRAQRAENV
jgi:hypothetical protein